MSAFVVPSPHRGALCAALRAWTSVVHSSAVRMHPSSGIRTADAVLQIVPLSYPYILGDISLTGGDAPLAADDTPCLLLCLMQLRRSTPLLPAGRFPRVSPPPPADDNTAINTAILHARTR
jgi:hypothetical protein